MIRITRRLLLGTTAAALAAPGLARAQATTLKVKVFPGLANLPLFAGQHTGAFERRGLNIVIENTPNSDVLRNGLAAGDHQLVVAGVDNAVAMAEAGHDIGILIGGDSAFNAFYVKPEIQGWAGLRGKTLIVDAPNTAYALVAYKMLAMNGLPRGSYEIRPTGGTFARYELMFNDPTAHASMLNPPFSLQAEDRGLRRLSTVTEAVGPYLGNAGWAMRAWAAANRDVVHRYLQGYIEGIRWMLAPANTDAVTALLAERLRIPAPLARRNLALLTAPETGSAIDGRFDLQGFRTVLAVRAEVLGSWGGTPPAPDRYLDLGYWERAVASL
ncbi:ABC transporter substrate-binding protein [Falsiroseomonas ponticola]|uniref:ABC transporter substrate-binding protein n=1 Tax=Falsiroseomonas ponticola TaxID=2786951 RepID=UPI001933DCAE|nr:ABC transporter substrate-binding protein [Roseomonas ponticola]